MPVSPGEHVSDETAHTPSLSQRVPAVLQHCVSRFAVRSHAEQSPISWRAPFLEPGPVTNRGSLLHVFATTLAGACLPASSPQLVEATLQQHVVARDQKCSPHSSLGSSQGVTSPPISNGCGRELRRLQLYRDQGTVSVVRRRRADEATAIAILLDPLRSQEPLGSSECPCQGTSG